MGFYSADIEMLMSGWNTLSLSKMSVACAYAKGSYANDIHNGRQVFGMRKDQ
jgi:hypothetical protein